MVTLFGQSASDGVAIGRIKQFKKNKIEIQTYHVEDAEAEIRRYQEASCRTLIALEQLYAQALVRTNSESADIFRCHQMLLSDAMFVEQVENKIRSQRLNAEFCVASVCDEMKTLFEKMEDDYIRERAVDVADISERLIRELSGYPFELNDFKVNENVSLLVFAENLTPGELIQMDKKNTKAIVTRFGSIHSHTSILARAMNIPMIIGVEFPKDCDGEMAIVDGNLGNVYVRPDESYIEAANIRQKDILEKISSLNDLRGKEDQTPEGKHIHLYANAGSVSDVLAALDHDASGIGLFRTEFLFIDNEKEPTEDEQFKIYKHIVELMAGKKVIFRTADIGTDKPVSYMPMDVQVNPAMGYRGIRISLDHPESLKCQLRALYRASAYGSLSIMYPMVVSVSEVEKVKNISRKVRQELLDEGVCIGAVEEGIMIETPAAALISDRLAKMVDFFSIGTNDLAAFTLAMDRTNSKLNTFFDPDHEAIFRLIEMGVKNGHEAGIWVGICGEMAADLRWIKHFIEIGVDEFSVTPSMILPLRQKIRE